MDKQLKGKVPPEIKKAMRKTGSKFKGCYVESTGHYIANAHKFTARQAAAQAIEEGYRPDIECLEDIRPGWAAYRFNGLGPTGYTEVEEGSRGAFPVWIMPVFVQEE